MNAQGGSIVVVSAGPSRAARRVELLRVLRRVDGIDGTDDRSLELRAERVSSYLHMCGAPALDASMASRAVLAGEDPLMSAWEWGGLAPLSPFCALPGMLLCPLQLKTRALMLGRLPPGVTRMVHRELSPWLKPLPIVGPGPYWLRWEHLPDVLEAQRAADHLGERLGLRRPTA